MNKLILITDTLLYRPGDVVTGHVWLDVCTATSGKSLHISLQGVETCERLTGAAGGNNEMFKNVVVDCDHLMFEANSAFPYGSYRMSFEITLPNELPGSFECDTLEGWKLSIRYMVRAYVVEDSDLSDTDSIVVSQSPLLAGPGSLHQPKNSQTFEVKQFLGLSKAQLLLECSLQEGCRNGLNTFSSLLTFDVNIQNGSKTCRIVNRSLKLMQCLTLCGPSVLTESVMHFVNGNNFKAEPFHAADFNKAFRTDINSNNMRHNANIANHAAKSASEWQRILLTEGISEKSCCSVQLDLSQCERKHHFESSVSGKTIKCQYQVVLSVTLDDGETFSAQPVDIWIHSHSDTKHMPSNTDKLISLKQLTMFHDAVALDESVLEIK